MPCAIRAQKAGWYRVMLVCSRLSSVGTIEKAGTGRAGSVKKNRGGRPPQFFFYQLPLDPHPLFRSSPLTESLEQASVIMHGRASHEMFRVDPLPARSDNIVSHTEL